jgi:hypothetical protein
VIEHAGVASLLPTLELLSERGHEVHIAFEKVKSAESGEQLEALLARNSKITVGELPHQAGAGWVPLARSVRRSIDYLRYLDPRYPETTKLRTRAASKAPSAAVHAGRLARAGGPVLSKGLLRTLQALERCLPPSPEVERYLAEQRPDVLLLAHLLPLGTSHADYLRAAKRLGIRTVFPVRGWDNLTNKGLLRDAPDLLLVWNDLQAREAEEMHGIPSENIRLTGAFRLDQWFGAVGPSRSREEFCDVVGLRADRPIVLYVCSSGFVARQEVKFVRSWVARLRERGGVFAEAGFLVRPHPLNAAQWSDAEFDDPQVVVWPRFGEAPRGKEAEANYYDSIYHSAAVVGINTTAQIEGAIVGRPVHTLLAEEFLETQQGTLHFDYLKADEFGLLYVGRTFDEHAAQLDESVRGREDDGRNERFVRRFVRPLGLERSGTEAVVEAMEELGTRPAPPPDRGAVLAPLVRVLLRPFARRSAAHEAKRRVDERTPLADLRHGFRKRALNRSGAPLVAGPWLGTEVDELLFWIPFLRAGQVRRGLAERLFVVCRGSSAGWYQGVGAGLVELEQLGAANAQVGEDELRGPLRESVSEAFRLGSRAFRVFPPQLVAAARSELATQGAGRTLAYEPLADLARSRGYVGAYGAEAVLAVLTGVPAVVLDEIPAEDAQLLSSFAGKPPFGEIRSAGGRDPRELIEELLGTPVEAAARA